MATKRGFRRACARVRVVGGMPKRYTRRGSGGRLLVILLSLAGLGVGVWLFGKRARDRHWDDRRGQNGR